MGTHTMRKLRLTPAVALLAVPAFVWADSGVGVDTWRANKLDPTGGEATAVIDPNDTSWLEPGVHRSPTGNLYLTPTQTPHPDNLSVWQIYGTFDVGYLHTTGDENRAVRSLYAMADQRLVVRRRRESRTAVRWQLRRGPRQPY